MTIIGFFNSSSFITGNPLLHRELKINRAFFGIMVRFSVQPGDDNT